MDKTLINNDVNKYLEIINPIIKSFKNNETYKIKEINKLIKLFKNKLINTNINQSEIKHIYETINFLMLLVDEKQKRQQLESRRNDFIRIQKNNEKNIFLRIKNKPIKDFQILEKNKRIKIIKQEKNAFLELLKEEENAILQLHPEEKKQSIETTFSEFLIYSQPPPSLQYPTFPEFTVHSFSYTKNKLPFFWSVRANIDY